VVRNQPQDAIDQRCPHRGRRRALMASFCSTWSGDDCCWSTPRHAKDLAVTLRAFNDAEGDPDVDVAVSKAGSECKNHGLREVVSIKRSIACARKRIQRVIHDRGA